MHIIGLIIALASAIFWVSRAASGAKDIIDVANTVKNTPRRMRFKKKASLRGIDLIDNAIDAATALMVSVARLSDYSQSHDGLISQKTQNKIISLLEKNMVISFDEADELLTQMRWNIQDIMQAETALMPMVNVLAQQVKQADLFDLSVMLSEVAKVDSKANQHQLNFIAKFRDRSGIN